MHDISHRLSEMALTICSILLAITTLTAEETPKDQLKRFQESIEAFKADIAKQKKLVEYPGDVRQKYHNSQWDKNRWYNLTEEQQKRLIRKNKLRAYPVCWSFEKFTSASSSPLPFMECPEQDCMYIIVESSVRQADGKYSEGHPTINFPDEVFPMKMLKDKKKLMEALDLYGKQTVYFLLVPQCGSINLRQFYMENFEAPLKDKIKKVKTQAKSVKKKKDKKDAKRLEEDDEEDDDNAATGKKDDRATAGKIDPLRGDYPLEPNGICIISDVDKKYKSNILLRRSVSPPFTVEASCQTDNSNIRITLLGGEVIFNWEGNKKDLRIDIPALTSQKNGIAYGYIPENTWGDIRIEVTNSTIKIYVNNSMRYAGKGNFKGIAVPVGVRTAYSSTVKIRKLTVTSPNDDDDEEEEE